MADTQVLDRKQEIRRQILDRRRGLGHAEMLRTSLTAQRRLLMLPEWKNAGHVCTFIGSKPGEVSTLGIIQAALDSGKNICVPVIDPESKELLLSPVTDTGNLARGFHGILEPADSPRVALDKPDWDLAVVPGLAFGRDGGRIGFGKGYYDRLLAVRKTPRIALAFSFQVLNTVPCLPHDVPVDMIVTERETIAVG